MAAHRKRSKRAVAKDRWKRWRWVALGLAFAAAVVGGLHASRGYFAGHQAERHFRRAERLLEGREHEAARAELRSALRLRPSHREARRQLAELELRTARLEHAFLEFHALTEMHSDDAEAWLGLGRARIAADQLQEAETAATEAVELAPDLAAARRLRAEVRHRLGRFHGARVDAQALVDRDPKDAAAWVLLARATARVEGATAGAEAARRGLAGTGEDPALSRALQELRASAVERDEEVDRPKIGVAVDRSQNWPGKLGALLRDFASRRQQRDWDGGRALALTARNTYPGTVLGPWLEGVLEFSQGHFESGEKYLLEGLSTVPRSHRVITNLGAVWSRQRGPAYAGDRLVQLAERDHGFVYPLPLAALAYVEARDPARAEAAIRRALDLLPGSPVPYRYLAEFHLTLDRAGEAMAICDEGLARFPKDLDLQLKRARSSLILGDREEAIRRYEAVLSSRPDHDLAAGQLARLLIIARKDESSRSRAMDLVRRLESNAPADPIVLDAMGWVYLEASSDARRARELLEAAARAAPDDPAVRFHLAVACARTGDVELARRELRTALSSSEPFDEEPDARRLMREIGRAEP
jgi:tetratricopeptide (TPR) repeat protein